MKTVRLSVNLSEEAAKVLRELAERRGISITEAIRRAIAVWRFFEEATDKGETIQVTDGKTVRELVPLR